jgi:hypothetical protein
MRNRAFAAAGIALAVIVVVPQQADAAFVATMEQVGADVVVTGSGTLNVLALNRQDTTLAVGASLLGEIGPRRSTVSFGVDAPALLSRYFFVTAPGNFGPGELNSFTTVRSGDVVAITREYILLDRFYDPVGRDTLSAAMTFQNRSFADLGVTPGTYVWSWGSVEGLSDTFTLNVLAPTTETPVPAPAGLGLFGLALAGLVLARRRPV